MKRAERSGKKLDKYLQITSTYFQLEEHTTKIWLENVTSLISLWSNSREPLLIVVAVSGGRMILTSFEQIYVTGYPRRMFPCGRDFERVKNIYWDRQREREETRRASSLIFGERRVYFRVAAVCYLLGNVHVNGKQFSEIRTGWNLKVRQRVHRLRPGFSLRRYFRPLWKYTGRTRHPVRTGNFIFLTTREKKRVCVCVCFSQRTHRCKFFEFSR